MWSFEYSLAVPYFRAGLGLSSEAANLNWIAGPITGLVVGPITGALSDRSTSRLGKRRPFVIAGLVCTCCSALLFSLSDTLFGPSTTGAAALAIAMFWAMDLSINTIQTPLRALLSDVAAADEQVLAQSVSASLAGCGQMLGFLVTACVKKPLDHLLNIYILGVGCLVCTAVTTVCVASERRPTASGELLEPARSYGRCRSGGACRPVLRVFQDIVYSWRHLSGPQLMLCAIHFFTWAAWFCHQQILTEMFGTVVFRGSASAKEGSPEKIKYSQGLQAGSAALVWQQFTSMVASAFFGAAQRWVRTKLLYVFSLSVVCACMLVEFLACRADEVSVPIVTAAVALTGIGYAGTQVFPYSIMGSLAAGAEAKGLAMGTLSVCIVTPQMIDAATVGAIAQLSDLSWVVLLGSCYSCLAAGLVSVLAVPA